MCYDHKRILANMTIDETSDVKKDQGKTIGYFYLKPTCETQLYFIKSSFLTLDAFKFPSKMQKLMMLNLYFNIVSLLSNKRG